MTLGDFITKEWFAAISGTVRPSTERQYRVVAEKHIVRRIGSQRLQALSAGRVNEWLRELERAPLAASTRRTVWSVLHRALRDAVRWGYLPRNPTERTDPPSHGRTRATAWTSSELRRFLEHVEDDRLYALWRLAATTGMRRGELLGLTWRCLDLDASRLSVEKQLIPGSGGVRFEEPKSSRSRRTVALDPETVGALHRHRETQLLERDFAADAYQDHDLAFCDALGNPLSPQRLSMAFTAHRKAAGIPVGTLHTLRHTAATLALTAGIPVHIVAARLGDTPQVLLATYSHLLPQFDELAAERVAAALAA